MEGSAIHPQTKFEMMLILLSRSMDKKQREELLFIAQNAVNSID